MNTFDAANIAGIGRRLMQLNEPMILVRGDYEDWELVPVFENLDEVIAHISDFCSEGPGEIKILPQLLGLVAIGAHMPADTVDCGC